MLSRGGRRPHSRQLSVLAIIRRMRLSPVPGSNLKLLIAFPLVLLLAGASDPSEEAAARILGSALVESRAYEKLSYLTDRIGHRLSGSSALSQAIAWAVNELKADGLDHVWTEKVTVPHWVRGDAQARIVAPVAQEMSLLALGGSVATPREGITAELFAVSSLEELKAAGDAVRGKIVFFNRRISAGFDAEHGYGSAVKLRVDGPSAGAKQGAVAMLIRSLGTASYRLPHTGALRYEEGVPRIPAAAIAAEDADLIERLQAAGEAVRARLVLGCKTLPDAESANVIAELRGREWPSEIVLIGAHLDSWDVGQGAHDDGAGVAVVMETMRQLKRHGQIPRRTIRAVLFTNEENGLAGARDYAERHQEDNHVAAVESDSGGAAPIGFGVTAGEGGVEMVRAIARHLTVIDAAQVLPSGGGADISPLKKLGVPQLSLLQDPARYFDYHHTAADTLDKVDRSDLDRNVAAMTLLAFMLAEQEVALPRVLRQAEDD